MERTDVSNFISDEHNRALALMAEARKILFTELHGPIETRQVLAEGLEKLGLAFEFVENPLGEVSLCPDCEGFCLEKTSEGKNKCLSCDHEWSAHSGGGCHAEH